MKMLVNILAGIFSVLLISWQVAEHMFFYHFKEHYDISYKPSIELFVIILFILIIIVHAGFIVLADSKISQVMLFFAMLTVILNPLTAVIYIAGYLFSKIKYKKVISVIIGLYAAAVILFYAFMYFAVIDSFVSSSDKEYVSPDGTYVVVVTCRETEDGNYSETSLYYRMNGEREYFIYKLTPEKRALGYTMTDCKDTSVTWISDNKLEFNGKKYVMAPIG